VLSGNILELPGPAIREVRVDHTVVDGKVVYTRKGG
jgi:hypothetical protein